MLVTAAGLWCMTGATMALQTDPRGSKTESELSIVVFDGDVYRLTGDERRCLREKDIKWIEVVDSETLIFATTDGGYYFNRVAGGIYCDLPTDESAYIDVYPSRTVGGPGVGASHNYCKNDGVRANYVRCTLGMYEEAALVEGDEGGEARE